VLVYRSGVLVLDLENDWDVDSQTLSHSRSIPTWPSCDVFRIHRKLIPSICVYGQPYPRSKPDQRPDCNYSSSCPPSTLHNLRGLYSIRHTTHGAAILVYSTPKYLQRWCCLVSTYAQNNHTIQIQPGRVDYPCSLLYQSLPS